jgi:hypothetical protein
MSLSDDRLAHWRGLLAEQERERLGGDSNGYIVNG